MWQAAQARSVARLAASPLDSRDFLLADVSLKQQRLFTAFSGDLSGRWIGVAAFLTPQYPKPLSGLPALLDQIPAHQKADGHFGAKQHLPKIDKGRDMPILWGNGRLLLGLVEVYQRTGNRKALETARKLGDYFIATDAIYNKAENIRDLGGEYVNNFMTCYFQVVESLVALSQASGEKRYMDEARRIAELAASIQCFDGFHSHARLTTMRGFAELYAATGQQRWLDATVRDWKTFMDRYRLPTGGAKERLDAECIRDEGCSEADWLWLNLILGRLTGEGRYWDEAQRALNGHFLYQQFANGGAGHRNFHQIDGKPVAFHGLDCEVWWCCSEHWPRATVDLARSVVTSGRQGPCINLIVDCEGMVAGPGGKWKVMLRETDDGMRIVLTSPAAVEATVRIHRPAWVRTGARVEAPASLTVHQADAAWLLNGVWDGTREITVHLPTGLRSEADGTGAGVLLRGHDLLVAHRNAVNAWLLDRPGGVRPVVLWAAALPATQGRVLVPASLENDPQLERPQQWKLLELSPLRAVAAQPHETAWFSFRPREATTQEVTTLVAKIR